jgi:hypothetical protein
MASTKKTRNRAPVSKLDSKPYADMVRKTTEMAICALKDYGEPTMSREELRSRLAKELPDVSLSEMIIKEREVGW